MEWMDNWMDGELSFIIVKDGSFREMYRKYRDGRRKDYRFSPLVVRFVSTDLLSICSDLYSSEKVERHSFVGTSLLTTIKILPT